MGSSKHKKGGIGNYKPAKGKGFDATVGNPHGTGGGKSGGNSGGNSGGKRSRMSSSY